MSLYQVKLVREEDSVIKARKTEAMLRDLVTIMPTLHRHQLGVEIHTEIKRLRAGRTQKNYTMELTRQAPIRDERIETTLGKLKLSSPIFGHTELDNMVVSRKWNVEEFKVSAPISRKVLDAEQGKVKLLRQLKTEILNKIRAARKANPVTGPVTEHVFREGIKVKKLAEVYLEPNTFYKLSQKRIRNNMTKGKVPFDKTNHIGVEIEFAAKEDMNVVCDRLWEAGLGKHIHAKRDGSIAVDNTYPHQVEIAIIARQSEIAEVIKRVCDVLNTKLHVRIDKSCGLHIHLDMRSREVENCFSNLIHMQRYLYSMVPAARKLSRDNGGFSQMIEKPEFVVPRDHYYGVNSTTYNKFQTLEIRMHAGTTQARKINNFISFLTSIVEGKKITKAPDTMMDVQETFGLSDSLRKYIESRIAKFAAQHKKTPNPKWMGEVNYVAEPADNTDNEGSEVA